MTQVQDKTVGRYLLLSGILVVLGLAGLGLAFLPVHGSILEQERRYMRTVARSTASSIENFFDGYLSGAGVVAHLPHFRVMTTAFRNGGDAGPMLDYLRTFSAAGDFPAAADTYILDGAGNFLIGTSPTDKYRAVPGHDFPPGEGRLEVFENADGALFIGITDAIDDDTHLCLLLDVAMMYGSTASFVTLGEKGYVMLKHSSGLIITHPVAEQVGNDVIEGRKRKYPDLDYSDLEDLIANQKSGKEGLQVYYSYWWADETPQRVRKISAYLSVPIQNDFLIVSAVNDYAELLEPILFSSGMMIAAAILITLGAVGMLLARRRENQRQMQRENEYLKELNRRQEETRHNQRLQMIGTLTGGIAHEFRNLLTPIMGYSGMMRESLPPDSPLRSDVDEIYTSAVRAKEIIQQVTSLSRKSIDPALEPVALDELLPGILKVASTFKPADVVMHTKVNFGGRAILGNKTQLNQIILNLCNNAFQAMPKGGNLWITGECRRSGERTCAFLIFRDDGVGIEPENLQRIFDPFFTTKRVGEGTGLGLSMVQNIVDLHGGTIEADSRPGEGARFAIRFPTLQSSVSTRTSAVRREHVADELVSIVLVEDDDHVMRLLHRGLAKSGFTTQAFSDPLTALAEIERNPCRLLVTDYDLPHMNGIELATRVREKFPGIKVLLLTGVADETILEYVENGVVDVYQIKPVPVSELVERIHSLFGQ